MLWTPVKLGHYSACATIEKFQPAVNYDPFKEIFEWEQIPAHCREKGNSSSP